MSKRVEPTRQNWKMRPASHVSATPYEGMRDGNIATPHGFVSAIVVHGERPWTSLRFVYAGRMHSWGWQCAFKDRYLVTMACHMAGDIVNATSKSVKTGTIRRRQ